MDATRGRYDLTNRSANTRVPPPRSTVGQARAMPAGGAYGQRMWVKLGDGPRLCPKCRSLAILPSPRRGILEALLLTLILARPFRCMDCGWRYYALIVNLRPMRPWFPRARRSTTH